MQTPLKLCGVCVYMLEQVWFQVYLGIHTPFSAA